MCWEETTLVAEGKMDWGWMTTEDEDQLGSYCTEWGNKGLGKSGQIYATHAVILQPRSVAHITKWSGHSSAESQGNFIVLLNWVYRADITKGPAVESLCKSGSAHITDSGGGGKRGCKGWWTSQTLKSLFLESFPLLLARCVIIRFIAITDNWVVLYSL